MVPRGQPGGPPPSGPWAGGPGPTEPSGGGRAFLIARFALYAVLIAIGGYYLFNRDNAQGGSTEPPGAWVEGTTSQQLPMGLKVHDGRVTVVAAQWRAYCNNGALLRAQESGFQDAFKGDFKRDGERFSDHWKEPFPWSEGRTGTLEARLQGESSDGVTRGSLDFTVSVDEAGGAPVTCESGPIGFAVDLPN